MPQLFTPRADVRLRTAALAVAMLLVIATAAAWAFARSPAATGQYRTYQQPVPFSHPLHVNAMRIDCRYCHAGVERAAYAGLPPTSACLPCHQENYLSSHLFDAVRASVTDGRPIPWRRVNSLADFVFFNHAVHVRSAVACDTCHGPVELMPQVYQAAPLTMEWCLQCHRQPERYIAWRPAGSEGWWTAAPTHAAFIATKYDVRRLTSCTTCHR